MIAGLVFQVISLLGFVALCADYAWSLYKNQDKWNRDNSKIYGSRLFKCFMFGMSPLILNRQALVLVLGRGSRKTNCQ